MSKTRIQVKGRKGNGKLRSDKRRILNSKARAKRRAVFYKYKHEVSQEELID